MVEAGAMAIASVDRDVAKSTTIKLKQAAIILHAGNIS